MIFVGMGGFFGAMMRYLVSMWLSSKMSDQFPWATFFINVSGSFLLGICIGSDPKTSLLLLCATGFLGAFTTFSTFSYEIVKLVKSGHTRMALLYVSSSIIFGIGFTAYGYYLVFSNL